MDDDIGVKPGLRRLRGLTPAASSAMAWSISPSVTGRLRRDFSMPRKRKTGITGRRTTLPSVHEEFGPVSRLQLKVLADRLWNGCLAFDGDCRLHGLILVTFLKMQYTII
jgi:hypothetical protein